MIVDLLKLLPSIPKQFVKLLHKHSGTVDAKYVVLTAATLQ